MDAAEIFGVIVWSLWALIVCAICIAFMAALVALPFVAIGWGIGAGAWLFCLPMAWC